MNEMLVPAISNKKSKPSSAILLCIHHFLDIGGPNNKLILCHNQHGSTKPSEITSEKKSNVGQFGAVICHLVLGRLWVYHSIFLGI